MALDQPSQVVDQLAATLAPDEHERAARFHFDRDRRRFTVARGMLRQLLGRCSECPPDAIRFGYGPFGKPYLENEAGTNKLEFSLSHSKDWALAAVARGRSIGVDVEEVRAMPDYEELAHSNFSQAEVTALLGLRQDQQLDGFFACWTRKEAYAKALGLGLSLDLSAFTVSVEPNEGSEIIPPWQSIGPCLLRCFRPLPEFWGAIAIETPAGQTDLPSMHFSTLSSSE